MPAIRRIALVGHCGFDAAALRRFVQAHAPDVAVSDIDDAADLDDLGPDTLLLVNRLLDGRFDADSGIDLIRAVAARAGAPRCLLISNYADAQASAVAAGARPGFGKSELRDPAAAQRLGDALT